MADSEIPVLQEIWPPREQLNGTGTRNSSNEDVFTVIIPGTFSPYTVAHLEALLGAIEWAKTGGSVNRTVSFNQETKVQIKIMPTSDRYSKESCQLVSADGNSIVNVHADYLSVKERLEIIAKTVNDPKNGVKEKLNGTKIIVQLDATEIALAWKENRHIPTGKVIEFMKQIGSISNNKEKTLILYGEDNIKGMWGWGEPLVFTLANLGVIYRPGVNIVYDGYKEIIPDWKTAYTAKESPGTGIETEITAYYDDHNEDPTKNITSGNRYTREHFFKLRGEVLQQLFTAVKPVSIPLNVDFSSSILRRLVQQQATVQDIEALNRELDRQHKDRVKYNNAEEWNTPENFDVNKEYLNHVTGADIGRLKVCYEDNNNYSKALRKEALAFMRITYPLDNYYQKNMLSGVSFYGGKSRRKRKYKSSRKSRKNKRSRRYRK